MGVFRDRLSALPDEVLFMIISLLPFKDAVSTAFLSKRWRFLPVTCLRNFEFKETDFVTVADPSDVTALEKQRQAFVDLVMCWIRRCRRPEDYYNSGSSKFTLTFACPDEHLAKVQRSVLSNAASKVDFLEFNFSDPDWNEDDVSNFYPDAFVLLPPFIRGKAFKNLQSLKLSACAIPDISPCCGGFPRLKSVTLEWITLQKGPGLLNKWLSKCPALQDLTMRRCTIDDKIEIVSESLKTLIMEKCCSIDVISPVLIINTPELKFLKYSGVLVSFCLTSTDLDLEASLDFGLQKQLDIPESYADTLWGSLNEFSDVKTLTVCSHVLQILPHGEEAEEYMYGLQQYMCNLTRLEHLTLKASLIKEEFYGITFFLKSCPNMEVLTIDLDHNTPDLIFPDCEDDLPFNYEEHPFVMENARVQVYPCLLLKLKRVTVEGFKGGEDELRVLKYLLKYGLVLESVHINIPIETGVNGRNNRQEGYIENAKSFLNFEKGSAYVQILLSSTPAA